MSLRLPNFLIVGAAKSGTTSLFDQLCQHPQVFNPYIKEPGFLNEENRFLGIRKWEDYQAIFEGAENFKAVGEASVTYLSDPKSPELIKKYLGEDVRIIILLRNPVDMAHSLWKHRRREMKEEFTFEEAVKNWEEIKEKMILEGKEYYPDRDYLGRSSYSGQVKNYLENFDKVKILIFEEYIKDPNKAYSEICDFLGIDSTFVPTSEIKNKSYSPRFSWIQKFLFHEMPLKNFLKKIFPHKMLVGLKSGMEKINQGSDVNDKPDPKTRKWMANLLKEDVEKLQKVLDRDLSMIWKDFQFESNREEA